MLVQRLLSALVALPLLVAVIVWGPAWLFAALVVALAARCQWELYRMFVPAGVAADVGPGLALGALVVLAFAPGPGLAAWLPAAALALAVAGCLAAGLARPEGPGPAWAGVALTLLGVTYCAWLLGHALWLRGRAGGPGLVLFMLAVTWTGETAAYAVGRRWGRRRLAPRVSPAKTVEGAAAQVVASVAVALAAAPAAGLSAAHGVALGGLLGVVGQVGDLAESFLKRSAGTKDSGAILPGHGGLLDRLDSLLFNVPALYYYLNVVRDVSAV